MRSSGSPVTFCEIYRDARSRERCVSPRFTGFGGPLVELSVSTGTRPLCAPIVHCPSSRTCIIAEDASRPWTSITSRRMLAEKARFALCVGTLGWTMETSGRDRVSDRRRAVAILLAVLALGVGIGVSLVAANGTPSTTRALPSTPGVTATTAPRSDVYPRELLASSAPDATLRKAALTVSPSTEIIELAPGVTRTHTPARSVGSRTTRWCSAVAVTSIGTRSPIMWLALLVNCAEAAVITGRVARVWTHDRATTIANAPNSCGAPRRRRELAVTRAVRIFAAIALSCTRPR